MKMILYGTKQLPSKDSQYRLFEKPGSLSTAMYDFSALNPRDVVKVVQHKQNGVSMTSFQKA